MGTQIETNMMRAARVRSWFPTLLWIRLGRLGWLTYFHGYWDYEMVEVQVPVASRHPVQQEIRLVVWTGSKYHQDSSGILDLLRAICFEIPVADHGWSWLIRGAKILKVRRVSSISTASPTTPEAGKRSAYGGSEGSENRARDQVIGMEFTLINGEHYIYMYNIIRAKTTGWWLERILISCWK